MLPDNPDAVAIAVLAKAPVVGVVQTKLALMLGVDGAAALQERFTRLTVERAVEAAVGPLTLWCSPDEKHASFRALAETFPLTLRPQPAAALSERMAAVFDQRPTLVIGTDCPALKAEHLQTAADTLRSGSDAVIFPSEGGGFVLIGLRSPNPQLFAELEGGTDTVLARMRRRLTQAGLSWREPMQLWDVERPSDVRRMRREGMEDLLVGIGREQQPPETFGFPWVPPHARRTA